MPEGQLQKLESLLGTAGIFSDIDIHFGRFVARFDNRPEPGVFLAAALTSRATGQGDICLDLAAVAASRLLEMPDGSDAVVCPPVADWHNMLMASPAVGEPGQKCPLILDERQRLYLYRYWEYENNLSRQIGQWAGMELQDFNPAALSVYLEKLFPWSNTAEVNWQAVAAIVAVFKPFSVITGGPGSGKTFTITGLMALFLACALEENPAILLAAPTGKAAARLAESIGETKRQLDCPSALLDAIPNEVQTIHRLLKPIVGTPYFRHNSNNPLAAELIVIDEASMVDLALMSKLVQAVAGNARLVLIGDKDQLASVEAGSVLGDICGRQAVHGISRSLADKIERCGRLGLNVRLPHSTTPSDLEDCITVLQKNYRFEPQSGIGGLSRAVNQGDSDSALRLLDDPAETSIACHDFVSHGKLVTNLSRSIVDGYRKYLTIDDPMLAMGEFMRFKILCALKIGPFGVDRINVLAEQILAQAGLLPRIQRGGHQWYRGRPVLITRNDYNLGLFNGDIGITLPDPVSADEQLYVYFPDPDHGYKRFPPRRLSGHETVYAMTVHKSQGSEFDNVILLLPQKDYPLLTRELIYTGLTRAKKTVSIWGPESVLATAIGRKIERTSGLRETLWEQQV